PTSPLRRSTGHSLGFNLGARPKRRQPASPPSRKILDRAYGKAPQPMEQSGERHLTHEEALEDIERRVNAANPRAQEIVREFQRRLNALDDDSKDGKPNVH